MRQITLPQMGSKGQEKLKHSKVLIVGVGGLGTPVALYLGAAGIGTLGIIDGDTVEHSNLARQVLFSEEDIGFLKVDIIEKELMKKNKALQIRKYPTYLDEQNAEEVILEYDAIVNGSDNFQTRLLLNQLCIKHKKTWIDAGVSQFHGQIITFYPQKGCFQCLFPITEQSDTDCSSTGVIGPICGMFGSLQAMQVIKVLLNLVPTENKVFCYDGLHDRYHTFIWEKRADCSCCAHLVSTSVNTNIPATEPETSMISQTRFLELISQKHSLIVDMTFGLQRRKLNQARVITQTLDQILNTKKDFYHQYASIIFLCHYGRKSRLAAKYAQGLGLNGLSFKSGMMDIFKGESV